MGHEILSNDGGLGSVEEYNAWIHAALVDLFMTSCCRAKLSVDCGVEGLRQFCL